MINSLFETYNFFPEDVYNIDETSFRSSFDNPIQLIVPVKQTGKSELNTSATSLTELASFIKSTNTTNIENEKEEIIQTVINFSTLFKNNDSAKNKSSTEFLEKSKFISSKSPLHFSQSTPGKEILSLLNLYITNK
jgi:hypothetical protein